MLVRGLTSGGGGSSAPTIDDLSFTNKTLLQSITTAGGSWTATEDCIMGGIVVGSSSAAAYVYFDNKIVLRQWAGSGSSYLNIGMSTESQTTPTLNTYGIFVPKGTVVKTRTSYGTYNLKFYSL